MPIAGTDRHRYLASPKHRPAHRHYSQPQSLVPSAFRPTVWHPPEQTATISRQFETLHCPSSFSPTATAVPSAFTPTVWDHPVQTATISFQSEHCIALYRSHQPQPQCHLLSGLPCSELRVQIATMSRQFEDIALPFIILTNSDHSAVRAQTYSSRPDAHKKSLRLRV